MIDPTPREMEAMRSIGPIAGEYIESLGKTDLALFSVNEFLMLIQVIITGYFEAKAKMDAEDAWDDIPF